MLKRLAILTLCALIAGSVPAHAGGWGVLTLDELPARITVNQPVTLGFTLRQHGQHMLGGQPGQVIFEQAGEKALQFKTRSTKAEGHYTATVTLPTAGVWQWRVELFGEHAMPPLTVTATAARAAEGMSPTQLAALGQDLFVAKGCSSCHGHQAVVPSGRFSSAYGAGNAPGLTTPKFDAAYLRAWLKDPKAVKPQTQMPNLNLKADEIEALAAFLAVKQPVACPVTQGRALLSSESAPIRSFVARGHVLSGIVRSGKDCAPIAGARITFLLANPQGIYDDAHSGTIITGPDGAYRFESNFPGQYEGSPAPHIHLLITAPGHRAIETEYLPKKGQTTGTFDVTLAAA
jgi:mono/diheme cytochrome c family protein